MTLSPLEILLIIVVAIETPVLLMVTMAAIGFLEDLKKYEDNND